MVVKKSEEIHSFCDYNIYHYREISSLVRKDLIFYELQVEKTQGMYPFSAWGEGGRLRNFYFGGGEASHNFEVKIKTA